MPAIMYAEYSPAAFGAMLHSSDNRFELDLHNYTLVDVLEENVKFKNRKCKGSGDRLSSLIYNIRQLEMNFSVTMMPVQVTDMFYSYFYQFLIARGIMPSTITTYFAQLKATLGWATKHNCPVSPTYCDFHIDNYHRRKYALTADQVSHIYHFDIDKLDIRPQYKRTLKRVRDAFVLSCNLGQRYSDIRTISPSNFDADRTTYTVVQQKTGTRAVVHLKEMTIDCNVTREILRRYGYHSPVYNARTGRSMDISHYNAHLCELLHFIGGEFLEQEITSQNKINGEIVTTTQKIADAITSHTGRRTFITYHIERHVDEPAIRRCSGHTDSRSFCKYIQYHDD